MTDSFFKRTLGLGSLVLLGLGGCSQVAQLPTPPNPLAVNRSEAASPNRPPLPLPENANFIVAAVERDGAAVVRINASRRVSNGDPFGGLFGGPPAGGNRVERGSGSGFIFDSNGLLMTNAHVVEGADRVQVRLKDGRTYDGQVLGADPVTDVAVVKIDAKDLPTVRIGNSDNLRPGEWAIAIGNPLGLDNTVTVGIISATGRSSSEVGIPDKRVGFIQTDAAINPGNSGGPLLNAAGEVIGINTAIRADGQGIGFAVPINTARRIADQIIQTGKASHPLLGVQMLPLTPEIARENNRNPNASIDLPETDGALIVQVLPNSPAAAAGIRRGDVITAAEGQPIRSASDLQTAVEKKKVGDRLALELLRQQQKRQVTVQLAEIPQQQG
ncbi:HhoA/HhoB/HtrA family serine endopeptidase [Synechococcus elongatus]|uniref:PDZ/DHR/GLGF n=2 Tax=Synechococcus elongatus TaxID=32046 RepID=Q31P88_SYNE7|nr:HhoA/HhoB/HtrA family serine endopeptidase [Synechococcus elongatus]ABB57131.1 PDZ/DHR/GLGF [Synechococcus elongatus PCC 7942 = FACHB-805]AJD58353.1 serine protease [Synechococcus elongatus UTEX 2973]MBD2587532.1 trypsin-like peptidase domain-containing protein [Synechococcus elongatus FACHB-242]MBD2688689.1 trypsin-like peptidase domain-containing protein [Synechococcus elongatus FACHB-1061]MBD2707760.1 trypsin-like peptidase domain-containing protein [Synechococcus elongatus PCC 7942 = FA